jgi:hypothetical protein
MFPVIYAIGGFVGGIIAAALCNLVAKWTGGLEFEVTDETPSLNYALERTRPSRSGCNPSVPGR